MNLSLAWRNIWRNPRRTVVILIAVVIGVWCMVFMAALMRGIAEGMIRNGVATLTGHIQIHKKGFRSDPGIENSMDALQPIVGAIQTHAPANTRWARRVRVSAVVANARHNAGVTLVGIDPAAEAAISFIGTGITTGDYLKADDRNAIIVGRALLDRLGSRLDRKLVLMSQAADGELASKAFRIKGVFEAEMEATEKQFVFVPLHTAQKMLKMGSGISEMSLQLPQRDKVDATWQKLVEVLSNELEVDRWRDLLPMLDVYLEMFDGYIYIWYLVVFVAMGFGIVNTTLMAVFERIREFGLLKALGVRPLGIVGAVLSESFLLLLIGMGLGTALGLVSCLLLKENGIDLTAFAAGVEFAGMSRQIIPKVVLLDMLVANVVVLLLGLLVCLYPAIKAGRISPIEAMAHT